MTMTAAAMLAHARQLMANRQIEPALAAFEQAARAFPGDPETWFSLSGTQSGLGGILSAIATAGRASMLAPSNPLYRAHLAQMQVAYGLWGDSLDTLAPLLTSPPDRFEPKLANAIGANLSLTGLEDRAQPWFLSAAAREAANPDYAFNAAQGHVHCGESALAWSAFERLIARYPDFAKAHWAQAAADAKTNTAARVDRIRARCARATQADEVLYRYALFGLLQTLGDPRGAFRELEQAMRLQRARIRYEGQDLRRLLQLTEHGRRLLDSAAGEDRSIADATTADAPAPIFIVGMPRSGTTLIERMLSNHPDVAQGGELGCFHAALRESLGVQAAAVLHPALVTALGGTTPDLPAVGARYLRLTAYKHRGFRAFTDKLPFNFALVPWIARALPTARIVHIVRDPVDTCFSNLKQLFNVGYGACYAQGDIAEYYRAYRSTMRHWEAALPGRILTVEYERVAADPQGSAAELMAFCGLSADDDAWRIERNAKPVATASASQVRESVNTRSIGAWRMYAQELQPLVDHFAAHPP